MIWESNKNYIDNHNTYAEEHGFTLEMNKFADLVLRQNFSMLDGANMAIICNIMSISGVNRVCTNL